MDACDQPSHIAEQLTPGLVLGPFYPVQQPQDADHILWRRSGVPPGARRLHFGGRVCTSDQQPVADVLVELWHADPAGRYPHPCAPHAECVDPGFLGYGRVRTGTDGRFAFASLVPGAYQTGEGRRATHLHLQITGRCDRLLTQVFLPDDAACDDDRWFRAAPRSEMLVARVVADDAGALHLDWTAILARG